MAAHTTTSIVSTYIYVRMYIHLFTLPTTEKKIVRELDRFSLLASNTVGCKWYDNIV